MTELKSLSAQLNDCELILCVETPFHNARRLETDRHEYYSKRKQE